jgi:hypothetical protein
LRNDFTFFRNFTASVFVRADLGQIGSYDVAMNGGFESNDRWNRNVGPVPYWTADNPNTGTPRLGVSYATGQPGDPEVDRGIVSNGRADSDRWIEDGSYFRIRNIELAYTLPNTLLSRIGATDSRIFISGQNLATFTKYQGLDPDIVGANANLEPGVDNGNYPASRILSVGLNVGF